MFHVDFKRNVLGYGTMSVSLRNYLQITVLKILQVIRLGRNPRAVNLCHILPDGWDPRFTALSRTWVICYLIQARETLFIAEFMLPILSSQRRVGKVQLDHRNRGKSLRAKK
jgi:hypothetical protein